MAPNKTGRFLSGLFGGRKRPTTDNPKDEENLVRKRHKSFTPPTSTTKQVSSDTKRRISATKLVISEEWDNGSSDDDDDEAEVTVVLPSKSTPVKRKKRVPPSKLYPVKIAPPAALDSDSDDTFATANDLSPKKKSGATPLKNSTWNKTILQEASTTPETFSTDSQDDSSGSKEGTVFNKKDEPEAKGASNATNPRDFSEKNERKQEKPESSLSSSSSTDDDDSSNDEVGMIRMSNHSKRTVSKKDDTQKAKSGRKPETQKPNPQSSSSSSSSSSDDDSSNDETEILTPDVMKRSSPASTSDSCSSSEEEAIKRARLQTQKKRSEPYHEVDTRDCSQQTLLISNTNKRARMEPEEEEESSLCPTMDVFQKSCWKCRATLKLEDGEFCLYAMHAHPLFKIPICSVCADEVLCVELDSAADPTQCSGCGIDEEDAEILLLCDACPRAFCGTCVASSHGGGEQGRKQVELLSNTDDKWSCPFCKPPAALESLQRYMERIGEEEESKERTVEDIISELEKVEAERKEFEYQMSPPVLKKKSAEVRAELCVSMKSMPMEEIDDAVEEEMEDWKHEWAKHDQRLSDRVLSLQEEIEIRGENLAGCYAAILGETKVDTDEPDWKKAADAEIQKREDEEEDADDISLQNPSHPSVYKKDIPEDIEDLGISDPGENENKHSVWRSGRRRAKAKDMQDALEAEEEMLRQRHIQVLRVVDDTEDVEEVNEEEFLTSGRTNHGASRIRRDGYQLIVRKKAERTRRTRTVRTNKRKRASASTIGNARGSDWRDGFDTNDDVSDLSDNDSVVGPSTSDGTFDNSTLVLSSPEQIQHAEESNHAVRTVSIAASLASKLKTHQASGVEFMWKQCFADLAYLDPPTDVVERVGGCILAHNMGLGKSFTCISLLHALLNHPSLVSKTSEKRQRPIRTVLLIVPTNVLSHWNAEIDQWTGQLASTIPVFNLGTLHTTARPYEIKQWKQKGGILLVSLHTFSSLVKKSVDDQALLDPGPDIIVADEAHLMLKNTTNKIFTALTRVKTRRRIALTGSPFQNNLLEYYRLVSWVRPGILGNSQPAFEREYVDPIMNGLSSDANPYAVRVSHERSKKLNALIGPYMQRKDSSTLRKELPPIQEVVLHVRQSRTQSRLYRAFASYKKRKNITNFFKNWQMIRPLHNHPGTLLLKEQKENKGGGTRDSPRERLVRLDVEPEIVGIATDTEEDAELLETASTSTVADDSKGFEENVSPLEANGAKKVEKSADANKAGKPPPTDAVNSENWWQKTADRHGGVDRMNEVEQGYKVVLLLHILVEAQAIGDKVLVFSQCLRTLDFLERVFGLEDWTEHVPSLSSPLPAEGKRGGWVKGRDYLRIDGETNFSKRGDLIARFNDGKSLPGQGAKSDGVDEVKAFLLSSTACGIGINLIAANRVVLFDNHFNPTILTQALYRSYRYGQTKSVFAYRFMTEGSVEEKIYSRSVNKTGVSLRVIDNKSIARNFTERELQDLEETDTWVQCDRCEKWRMLPPDIDQEDLPKEWYCEMNERDEVNNSCDVSEKDKTWYDRHLLTGQADIIAASHCKGIAPPDSSLSLDEKSMLVENDVILKKLLNVTASDQQTSIISKHYFHHDLLAETQEELMDDEAFAAVTATVEGVENQAKSSSAKAPTEVPVITQPNQDSLCESVDKIFLQSPSGTSIRDILQSLEEEYGVKFDKATKAIVRNRLKELLYEKLKESPAMDGDEVLSNATTAAKSPPAEDEQGPDAAKVPPSNVTTSVTTTALAKSPSAEEEQDPDAAKAPPLNVATADESVEVAKRDTETPPCTPRKKMPTSKSSSKARGTSSKKVGASLPDSLLTHETVSPVRGSTPRKSRARQTRKRSDSPPLAEKQEEQGPKSPRRGDKYTETEQQSPPLAAQVAPLPVGADSAAAKPSGRKGRKHSHPNASDEDQEKKRERISPHRTRRSLGKARLPRPLSKPEVIELSSDSDDADADIVEILD